jgi:hypothetical protein
MKLRTLAVACAALATLAACSQESQPPQDQQAQEERKQPTLVPQGPTADGPQALTAGSSRRPKTIGTTPPPRDANGHAILGSAPGMVGSWEGFGSRPMLVLLDETPPGSIIQATPYEEAVNDPNNFKKIKYSDVPYQPWAKELYTARSRTRFEPYVRCKPSAGAREVATAYGTQIVDFPEMQKMYIFPTGGPRHFREIWMDGRGHPDNLKPTYHGHSIGHWEGDTLVVDTVGFNEKMWFDAEGSPHTDKLHLIEKFTRESVERLKYEITVDDPGAYTKPWSSGFYMDWTEGESFQFVCQDANMAYDLMLGTEYKEMDRSQPTFP